MCLGAKWPRRRRSELVDDPIDCAGMSPASHHAAHSHPLDMQEVMSRPTLAMLSKSVVLLVTVWKSVHVVLPLF